MFTTVLLRNAVFPWCKNKFFSYQQNEKDRDFAACDHTKLN